MLALRRREPPEAPRKKKEKKMFLSLGSSVSVKKSEVIGIFDLDNLPADSPLMEFLKENEKKKNVTVVGMGIPKAVVVTDDGVNTKIYLTTISASSIKGKSTKKFEAER